MWPYFNSAYVLGVLTVFSATVQEESKFADNTHIWLLKLHKKAIKNHDFALHKTAKLPLMDGAQNGHSKKVSNKLVA